MFTSLKKSLASLKNKVAALFGAPTPPTPVELSLGERFNLEAAPTPSEAEDAAIMGTDAQTIDYEQATMLAGAAAHKYGVGAVHVDPATARVRISERGGETPWFWAEPDTADDTTDTVEENLD